MNQRSETSSSLFLDTAHGETACSTDVDRRIHVATEEAQVVTVMLAVRRCTPIVAVAAHVAHATVFSDEFPFESPFAFFPWEKVKAHGCWVGIWVLLPIESDFYVGGMVVVIT